MIEIIDTGIILGNHHYALNKYIIHVLTKNHGRISGFSRKMQGSPGSIGEITWHGRLIDHLGIIKIEITSASSVARHWQNIIVISVINAIMAAAMKFIPEHNYDTKDYELLLQLLNAISSDTCLESLIRWERYLGYKYINVHIDKMYTMQRHCKVYPQFHTKARADLMQILNDIDV